MQLGAIQTLAMQRARLSIMWLFGTGFRLSHKDYQMHPLVSQYNFACDEFERSLSGLTDEDIGKRLLPSNSISWIIAHVAQHAQYLWVQCAQGEIIEPRLLSLVESPNISIPLEELMGFWHKVQIAAGRFLETVTEEQLDDYFSTKQLPGSETIGTSLLRITAHIWYHNGEVQALRQQLGQTGLPQFVGNLDGVKYRSV